jgi:hypothetical protein
MVVRKVIFIDILGNFANRPLDAFVAINSDSGEPTVALSRQAEIVARPVDRLQEVAELYSS